MHRGLTKEEMDHYRQGFTKADGVESRRPILAFVRSIPVAGEPADVVAIMDAPGRNWHELDRDQGERAAGFVRERGARHHDAG